MIRLAWLTDIHLNFLNEEKRKAFYINIKEALGSHLNHVLISGDIAEARDVKNILLEMEDYLQCLIIFVLGNHDFYHGSVKGICAEMVSLWKERNKLYYLPMEPLMLRNGIVLVGANGWADGRYGDYNNSHVLLNDSILIEELKVSTKRSLAIRQPLLLAKMQALADIDAFDLEQQIKDVLNSKPSKIIILTHVPPFKEAALYRGVISDDDHLPFYASKVMGDVLLRAASDNPGIEFLVLCGHTHGKAEYQALPNLLVKVGAASYREPQIQEIFEV